MSALPGRPPSSTPPGRTPAPVTPVVLQHPDPEDQLMDDTMDRANDPGGASSSSVPVNPIDLTMPTREQTYIDRRAEKVRIYTKDEKKGDVDMAMQGDRSVRHTGKEA